MASPMTPAPIEIRFNGVHCNQLIERFPNRVVVLRINGTDVGEFGDAPMNALSEWLTSSPEPIDFFIADPDVAGRAGAAMAAARAGEAQAVLVPGFGHQGKINIDETGRLLLMIAKAAIWCTPGEMGRGD